MRHPANDGAAARSRGRYQWAVFAFVAIIAGWTLLGAAAQEAPAEATDAEPAMRSVWDGVYTVAQARRGRRVYRDECGSCHKVDEFESGYATAFELYTSRDTMPEADPGVLSEQAYVDLIAYVLRSGDKPAGDEELPPDPEALKLIDLTGEKPAEP